MTPEEFRSAYLEAQNGMGNDLQALISLAKNFSEMAAKFDELVVAIQNNYTRMNEVIEQFLNEQENQP